MEEAEAAVLGEDVLEDLFSLMAKYPRGTTSANLAKEYEELKKQPLPPNWLCSLAEAAEFELQYLSEKLTLVFTCDKQSIPSTASAAAPDMLEVIDARISQTQLCPPDMAETLKYPDLTPGALLSCFVVKLFSGTSLFVQTEESRARYEQLCQDLLDNYGDGESMGHDITSKVLSREQIQQYGLYAVRRTDSDGQPLWGRAIVLSSREHMQHDQQMPFQCFFPDDGSIEMIELRCFRRLIPDAMDYEVCAYHCSLSASAQLDRNVETLRQMVFARHPQTGSYTVPKLNRIKVLSIGHDSSQDSHRCHVIEFVKDDNKPNTLAASCSTVDWKPPVPVLQNPPPRARAPLATSPRPPAAAPAPRLDSPRPSPAQPPPSRGLAPLLLNLTPPRTVLMAHPELMQAKMAQNAVDLQAVGDASWRRTDEPKKDHNANVLQQQNGFGCSPPPSGDAPNNGAAALPHTESIKCDTECPLKMRSVPDELPRVVDAYVVSAPDPACFVIRLKDDEIVAGILADIMARAASTPLEPGTRPRPGSLYSAHVPRPSSRSTEFTWQRVCVSGTISPSTAASDASLVRAFMVDVGEFAAVPIENLRPLPPDTGIAECMQAIKCTLGDAQPYDANQTNSSEVLSFWSNPAQDEFERLVLGKAWKVELLRKLPSWRRKGAPALPFVSVRLLRPDSGESVADVLIRKKLARPNQSRGT